MTSLLDNAPNYVVGCTVQKRIGASVTLELPKNELFFRISAQFSPTIMKTEKVTGGESFINS